MTAAARPPDVNPPHQRRDLAESFGAEAERYDRTRPRYPAALVSAVLSGLPRGSVLDVGIGTGIAALGFRHAGASVFGVDVDPAMAAVAQRRGFDVEIARFEQWDPAGRTFDVVIAGQTWHWIDPVAGAAKAAEVLRPGGRLAVFWNVGDPPAEVAAGFAELYRSLDTGLPFTPFARSALDGYSRIIDPTIAGILGTEEFSRPETHRFEWSTTVTRDAWLDQVPTAGGFGAIPPAVQDELLAGMGAIIEAAGGAFLMSYTTVAIVASRRAAD